MIGRPSLSPSELPQTLREQLDCARTLLVILEAERTALLHKQPPEELERITAAKAAATETLRRLAEPLRRLGGTTAAEVEAALARLPQGPEMLGQWQELQGLAAQCQRANQENAALLEARHRQVRESLRQLRGEQAPQTYGQGGYSALKLGSQRLGSA